MIQNNPVIKFKLDIIGLGLCLDCVAPLFKSPSDFFFFFAKGNLSLILSEAKMKVSM